MSYSLQVKDEIIKTSYKKRDEIFAEITAVFRNSGNFSIVDDSLVFEVTTENPAFARRIFSLTKTYYKVNSNIVIIKSERFRHHNIYIIHIENKEVLRDITENMEIEYANGKHIYFKIPDFIISSEETKKAYVKGLFLSAGSISNPEKTYHLEVKTRSISIAQEVTKILEEYELKPKILKRNINYIVYIKEGENIKDFLGLVGAHNKLMDFENVRILKEMRNNVNRIVNCETSNLDKTINAGLRQVQEIELIQKTIGLESLPENLHDIAVLRLENENLSLLELSELTSDGVGKSGVNHRMKKISRIAEKIREQNR